MASDMTSGEELIEAIKAKDVSRVRQLITDDADVNEMPEEESPLGVAVEMGLGEVVDVLLKAGAEPNAGLLTTPLVIAASKQDAGLVRKLLDAGAEIDRAEEGGMTPLMMVAGAGDVKLVKILIDAGADAKAVDEDGRSALAIAQEKGRAEVIAMLEPLSPKEKTRSRKPANDIDALDKDGRTKFFRAVWDRDLQRAKELHAAGANIEIGDFYGTTPLLKAIGNKPDDRAMIKWLVEIGANIHAEDENRQTVLTIAARYLPSSGTEADEDETAFRQLLIDTGIVSEAGVALTTAAGDGDLETVKQLLAKETNPDATDEQGRTALFMAVSRRRPEIVAQLLKSKAEPSKPITRDEGTDIQYGGIAKPCVKCNKPFISMTLIRECPHCGGVFDVRETWNEAPGHQELVFCWSNGWTPLMAAARLNDVKLAGILLDAGAKIEVGKSDVTPLMCACTFGHVEMVKFLIDRGAKVNAISKDDDEKMTPVEVAGKEGNVEVLELLWAAGAKTENKDAARLTLAARAGDVQRVKALLKAGVDVNGVDPFSNDTAVAAAAHAGQPDALRVLLQAGGSVAAPKRGLSPLFLACSAIGEGLARNRKKAEDVPPYLEAIKQLIDAGAPVKIAVWGTTPLGFAKEAKCKPLIELLEVAIKAQDAAKKSSKTKPKK